jgi:hypothetical protein
MIAIFVAALWKSVFCRVRFVGMASYWFLKTCQWAFAVNAAKNFCAPRLRKRLMPRWSPRNVQAAFCKCLCINIRRCKKIALLFRTKRPPRFRPRRPFAFLLSMSVRQIRVIRVPPFISATKSKSSLPSPRMSLPRCVRRGLRRWRGRGKVPGQRLWSA